MKSTYRLVAFFLLPLFVISIFACGNMDKKEFNGTFKLSTDISNFSDPIDPFTATMTVKCRDGGTITCEGSSCSGDDFNDDHDGHCTCLHPFDGKECTSANDEIRRLSSDLTILDVLQLQPFDATATATCKNGAEISCEGSNCSSADWDDDNNYHGDAWCGCARRR